MFEHSIIWEDLFASVYSKLGDKEYRIENKLHVKVRLSPATYKEYRLAKIKAEDGYFAGKFIKFNLVDDSNGNEYNVNVYPAFELKSDGKIVNAEVIFEMIAEELGIKTKVTADVTIV